MGLFSFRKKHARTIALIDIGSASVGGAYAHYEDGKQPVICYATRVDVASREGESIEDAMLRSLAFCEQLLAGEGAPQLRREIGNAAIDKVVASIAAPWQDTIISTARIQEKHPFAFTKERLNAAARTQTLEKGRVSAGRTVIATVLNGYEVAKPFGKQATRAEMVLLSSTVDRDVEAKVRTSLRQAFHTGDIEITAFAPAAYAVFRSLYPHQKDFVLLDVSGTGTDIVFVKQGLLLQASQVPQGTLDLLAGVGNSDMLEMSTEESASLWLQGLHDACSSFATDRALPRTVFLLADKEARQHLKRIIEKSGIRALWTGDAPLAVITVEPSHLAARVKTRGSEGDLFMSVLALYAAHEDEMRVEEPGLYP